MKQEEIYKQELDKMKEKMRILKKLLTVNGFIDLYYESLKNSVSRKEAFYKLNDMYYDFTGTYRYSSFKSFCEIKNRKLKKQ